MQTNGLAFHKDGLESLNAQTVQRRGAVEHDRMILDDLFEDVPHSFVAALDHALAVFDVGSDAGLDHLLDDERLEQLKRHPLGQTALIQAQERADGDNGTA